MKTSKEKAVEKWVITGGCGFIGTQLIERLKTEKRVTIRVLDNLSVGTRKALSFVCEFSETPAETLGKQWTPGQVGVQLVVGDIRDAKTCLRCCNGADIVVHLAANTGVEPSINNPRQDLETNVLGIFNMLEAAKSCGINRFVFASSGAPSGECIPPIHEELAARPVSPYSAGKLAGEGYCSAYYRTFGLETVALRFGNVYGPGSGHKSSVLARFIRQAIMGETCIIFGDGTQTRDFIFIDDLVDAIFLAATTGAIGGEIFQIATNAEKTVNEVAQTIKTILSSQYGITMKIAYSDPRIGDVKRNYSDTTKAGNILKWYAKTNFKNGVKKTIDWFLNTGDPSDESKNMKDGEQCRIY